MAKTNVAKTKQVAREIDKIFRRNGYDTLQPQYSGVPDMIGEDIFKFWDSGTKTGYDLSIGCHFHYENEDRIVLVNGPVIGLNTGYDGPFPTYFECPFDPEAMKRAVLTGEEVRAYLSSVATKEETTSKTDLWRLDWDKIK